MADLLMSPPPAPAPVSAKPGFRPAPAEPARLRASAAELREVAGRLLQQLRADQQLLEDRLRELGGRDPIRLVTGRSAIERAEGDLQQMIGELDALDAPGEDTLATIDTRRESTGRIPSQPDPLVIQLDAQRVRRLLHLRAARPVTGRQAV